MVTTVLNSLRAHKLRATLAIFGVMWGTLAVSTLLAVGQGYYTRATRGFASATQYNLVAYSHKTSMAYKGIPRGYKIHLRLKDVLAIPKYVDSVDAVAPNLSSFALDVTPTIYHQQKKFAGFIDGVSANFAKIKNLRIAPGGRGLSPYDIQQSARVTVIGHSVKQALFADKQAVGQQITINRIPFTIIGIIQDRNANSYFNRIVYVPYSTFKDDLGRDTVNWLYVKPKLGSDSQQVQRDIIHYFAQRYHFNPKDEKALRIYDATQIYTMIAWIFRGIEIFLGFCGVMTLGVGGAGLANILFLNVSERTNEIGLRKALGATDRNILSLFLSEALAIVGIGGVLGSLSTVALIFVLRHVGLPSWLGIPTLNVGLVGAIIGVLLLVALLAGYFPARRAMRLQPREALTC